MYLTIDALFNDANVLRAIIDRTIALGLDEIFWQRNLTFEETQSRVFKSYMGTVLGVTAGSVIDKNAERPLRNRSSLGSGMLEVIQIGDRYQMDTDRLDALDALVRKFNEARTESQKQAMNAIIDYIVDDMRQCILAPHKRMDLLVGSLRSTGKAQVTVADNENGVSLVDMEIPVNVIAPAAADKTKFISFLKEKLESLKLKYGKYAYMEMSRSTFNKNIVGCSEFGSTFKMVLTGKEEFNLASGLITSQMATQVFTGVGLPSIRINEDMVQLADGTFKPMFADDRISLFHSEKQGKMRWYDPFERRNKYAGKAYTDLSGGQFISSKRSEEGTFTEYFCEWVPEIANPNKITILDLSAMNA